MECGQRGVGVEASTALRRAGINPGTPIIGWNVGSGGLESNIEAVSHLLKRKKPGVVHLVDTRASKERAAEMRKLVSRLCPGYTIYFNAKSKTEDASAYHSIMTLVHDSWNVDTVQLGMTSKSVAGRLLLFKILPPGASRPLFTANIYLPVAADTSLDRPELMKEVETFLKTAREAEGVILLMGDFNAALDSRQRQGYAGS